MTRAYVLDPVTRATLGLVDQSWERLSYVRRYAAMDTFELVINRSRLWAAELATGRLLYLPDEGDLVFLIEQIASTAEGSTRNDAMTVTGRSLEGIAMAERLVTPPAGESHDRVTDVAAETAMKHYVAAHAADLAAAARQVPGLAVAPDAARGAPVTAAGRYQTVLDLVREIGLLAGLGWEITYDPAGDAFVFDVVEGVDRQASVFFDFAFETLERTDDLDSILDAKTVALVAGQGEGADRDLVTRFAGSEPTGFARREAFLDARDVELGATTVLAGRGDAFLAAAGGETSVEADVHQYGAFRYREHWDVGDVVLVRNAARGISYAARIVEVTKAFTQSAAAPTITAVLGRPFPSLQSRTSGSASGGAQDKGGAVGTLTVSASPRLIGRHSAGAGAAEELDPATARSDLGLGPLALASSVAHGATTGQTATDHHPAAGAGPDADITIDAAGAAGTAATFARNAHGHKLATYASTPVAVDATAGSAGTAGSAPARGNHRHGGHNQSHDHSAAGDGTTLNPTTVTVAGMLRSGKTWGFVRTGAATTQASGFLPFATAIVDSHPTGYNATNKTWTVPTGGAGLWIVAASIVGTVTGSVTVMRGGICINGVQQVSQTGTPVGGTNVGEGSVWIGILADGDTISVTYSIVNGTSYTKHLDTISAVRLIAASLAA